MISIYALVKRATETNHDTTWATVISIHALVKRATGNAPTVQAAPLISIHALVKRATVCQPCVLTYGFYFNPRPREEGDVYSYSSGTLLIVFQSTPS